MVVFTNAKINIGLNIIEKRNDGFHNIQSVFYPIKLKDILEIVKIEDENSEKTNNYVYNNTGIIIESPEPENLIIKAFNLLSKDYKIPSIKIHLHKIIPIGAGLGGGSSNAAYMLRLLNSFFDLQITNLQLTEYARKLGSDCAFFIENKPVYATQKGDFFSDINLNLDNYKIIVQKPNVNISTKEAYSGIKPKKPEKDLKKLIELPIYEWKYNIVNDFEKSIFKKYPEIEKLKKDFYDSGAIYSSMTGSGSAVYGIFKKDFEFTVPQPFRL